MKSGLTKADKLLAYHIPVIRGCDVDRPRNLAKSVTVEQYAESDLVQ
jgi:glucosamine 6-phosphate synthetase-like amidotransferase/phosphosugar isomerase protein